MSEVGEYLWANYYANMPEYNGRPYNKSTLEDNLRGLSDRIVVIRSKGKIKGVAIYLAISDETYSKLEALDITTEDVVHSLASQRGPNAHFILACGGGFATIRMGIKELKRRGIFKTASWWNPKMTKLHKYNIKEK